MFLTLKVIISGCAHLELLRCAITNENGKLFSKLLHIIEEICEIIPFNNN